MNNEITQQEFHRLSEAQLSFLNHMNQQAREFYRQLNAGEADLWNIARQQSDLSFQLAQLEKKYNHPIYSVFNLNYYKLELGISSFVLLSFYYHNDFKLFFVFLPLLCDTFFQIKNIYQEYQQMKNEKAYLTSLKQQILEIQSQLNTCQIQYHEKNESQWDLSKKYVKCMKEIDMYLKEHCSN